MSNRKLAFVFPGQAAQHVGMGKAIADEYEAARAVFELANQELGQDLMRLCFDGPKEELDLTENTQPAVLTASYAILAVVREKTDVKPSLLAGHSLGEYTAAVCAGCLEFTAAVKLVRRRAQLMQEAVPVGKGGMVAVMGSDRELVESVCEELRSQGEIRPSNINCPGQIVISGETGLLDEAIEKLKERGARKLVKLPLSAPFHSRLVEPASERFGTELDSTPFEDAEVPIVANASASPVQKRADVVAALKSQMVSPVLWEDSVKKMIEMGVTDFVEIGPQKIVSSFIKRISKDVNVTNIEGPESLEDFRQVYG